MGGYREHDPAATGTCSIHVERDSGRIVFRLEGELDRSNVASLEAMIAAEQSVEDAVADVDGLHFLDLAGARALLRFFGPPADGRLRVGQDSSTARLLAWMLQSTPVESAANGSSAGFAGASSGYRPSMHDEPELEDDEVIADGRNYRAASDGRGEGLADGSSYRDAAGDDEELGEADGESYRRATETDGALGAGDGSSYRESAAQREDAKDDSASSPDG